ncbi:hypothetical protein SXCC_00327 [Gluconacetobacter sp. SXCC-1]|nr:hypothetical protein SXCC_00327 [Gluconacetobacter sp. SXCC-1]
MCFEFLHSLSRRLCTEKCLAVSYCHRTDRCPQFGHGLNGIPCLLPLGGHKS